jgi:hypothetical protein
VTIFDVGFDAESPFLVMEFLPGETLADLLDRDRMPLPAASSARAIWPARSGWRTACASSTAT